MTTINYSQEEIPHLRSQNDQLWKIIEKQRLMIQNLQKDNVRLSAERDGIQDKYNLLEKEMSKKQRVTSLLISPQGLREIAEADDIATPTETSPVEAFVQPMPPPRSPYRPFKERSDEPKIDNEEPELPSGRSSPAASSPYPSATASPEKHQKPRPEFAPFVVPAQSKSADVRKLRQREQNKPKRESMIYCRSDDEDTKPDEFYGTSSPDPTISSSCAQESKTFIPIDNNNAFMMGTNMSNVCIKVLGSNIRPNDKGKEVVSFVLSIGFQHDDELEERWRVEKLYSDFLALDAKLKTLRNRALINKIGKLPDKALFSNNAPSKVDQRKAALETYLQHIVSLPLEDTSDLCEFLSTNVVEDKSHQIPDQKEGYLTKRGKNFGGWKTRYFVLNDNVLEYYEYKEGVQLGSIRLTNAQIGRQMMGGAATTNADDSVYRHAFLIVEQKRAASSHYVRHILCANSDHDRDEWVHALLQHIEIEDVIIKTKKSSEKSRKSSKGEIRSSSATTMKSDSDMDKLGVAASASNLIEINGPSPSISSESVESLPLSTSLPSNTSPGMWEPRTSLERTYTNSTLQAPRNAVVRRSSMGNLTDEPEQVERSSSPVDPESEPEKKAKNKANRMTFWGKKMFSSNPDPNSPRVGQYISPATNTAIPNTDQNPTPSGIRGFLIRSSHEQNERMRRNEDSPKRHVFGVPLDEAVRISRVAEGYELPAVVYRCIEYLDAMDAVMEEGLYRLSGSNSTMKALKDKFNQEGDVNLLAAKEEYDIHVVAGLLKLWLRDLPTSVLTREHRLDFLHVIDLLDRKDRVNELGRLVSLLPLANYTLLRALTAHLIRVVQHSDINKMTMRNVSIVFSPTLGIPATIFNLFMSEFEYIFWTTKNGDAAPRMLEDESEEEEEPEIAPLQEGLNRKTTLRLREEHGRSNRNSVNYMDGAPHAIVDLEKNMDGPPVLDESEEEVDDLTLSNDSGFH
ncbi:hypothetical protein BDB01DRAFT_844401 [Pilobolus umbonatus]|nr:hypothetical protein BDB01DRAFT_844401 [Pilobolus umbonatus]